ncbi:unnamed protein product [Didymodactylos carnosus]|nr:unnamed protein product [Didymodactylos carnosus]
MKPLAATTVSEISQTREIQIEKTDFEPKRTRSLERFKSPESHELPHPIHRSTTLFGTARKSALPVESVAATTIVAEESNRSFGTARKSASPVESSHTDTMTCRPLVTFETTNISKLNELDQTAADLRKLVMGKMINNPKNFSGATGENEDVGKWLEEVETQFDNGDIQDSSKLAIISYHLKSEALVWYRENRKNITTRDEFVKKITKAFKSSHHSELAYRKLETYTQTGTQTIRNYYSEMIQIFREADPCMSDHEKLRYLFKNMKSSLQYEIRKTFPKTPSQFSENALEIEDLLKLNQVTPSSTTTTVMTTSTNNNPAVATFVSDDENPRNPFYNNNSRQNNQ